MRPNRRIVFFRVSLDEMASEVSTASGFLVEVIADFPGDLIDIGAMKFAASLLENSVAIKEITLTNIPCST
jgi:hypothetical protein